MRVLDLFSGIGGFSLGLERAGFETIAFCENDGPCKKVLRKHWPKVPIYSDIKNLCQFDFAPGEVELICGGFPCQDISVAGNGAGLAGSRSGLWYEYKRIIEEIKPKYVIIENVANLRSKGLTVIIKSLGQIGYDVEWNIIPARSLGAHHLRERVWIVAKLSDGNNIRLFPAFATEKEKQKWWSKTAARFGDVWGETQYRAIPKLRGIPHGLSRRLDVDNVERIRQLGNAVLPQIPQLIGEAINEYEFETMG